MVRDDSSPIMTVLMDFVLGSIMFLDFLRGKKNKHRSGRFTALAVSFRRSLTGEGIDLACQLSIESLITYWWVAGFSSSSLVPRMRVRPSFLEIGDLPVGSGKKIAAAAQATSSAGSFLRE